MPKIEFPDSPRGDALYAMELSLALEKLNYEKLLEVHAAGEAAGDSQLMDFIESTFLDDQLNSIKEISDWVTQLRRVGDGRGSSSLTRAFWPDLEHAAYRIFHRLSGLLHFSSFKNATHFFGARVTRL